MIRVTGIYRWENGARFDHAYYASEHMRVAKEALLPHGLLKLESDRFLSPGVPQAGQIIATTNAYFPTLEMAQAAMAKAAQTLIANVASYTNLRPQMHMSEVSTHV